MYCYAQPANLRTSTVFVLINYNRELKISIETSISKKSKETSEKQPRAGRKARDSIIMEAQE